MPGMCVWHFKFSSALMATLFPSSMGMFVYMFVTSIELRKMSFESYFFNGFYEGDGH